VLSGETAAVLSAWAGVQWLSWEALAHAPVGRALPEVHHEVSAVAGVAGGVLVILGAERLSRSPRHSRRQSLRLAVAAALASLLVGAGHVAGGTLPRALSALALVLVVALVQAVAAALACVLYRAAARAWRRVLGGTASSAPPGAGRAVDSAGRVLVARWRGTATTPRAPPAVSPA
jgi:hypothetical protein